jgi:hypothetical protein
MPASGTGLAIDPRSVKEGTKRERRYEHVKDSYEDRGVSAKS